MNRVKTIAYLQIILSLVFVFAALMVQSGPSTLFGKYADACEKISVSIKKHNKEVFQPVMQSVFKMQQPLADIGSKVNNLAGVMQNTGKGLQKWGNKNWVPDGFTAWGYSVETTGNSIGSSGKLLIEQSRIIGNYRENVYSDTVQTLDTAAEEIANTSAELRRFESYRSPVILIIAVSGLIFLLNGIALLTLANEK